MMAAMAVNTLEFSSVHLQRALQHPFLLWTGAISFSLYLWQQVFLSFIHAGMSALLAVPLAVACAVWSFKRVEEPARNYLNMKWTSPRFAARAADPLHGSAG
jgi:peptidoglycan/LPS O-acetylase OafA/YrhL